MSQQVWPAAMPLVAGRAGRALKRSCSATEEESMARKDDAVVVAMRAEKRGRRQPAITFPVAEGNALDANGVAAAASKSATFGAKATSRASLRPTLPKWHGYRQHMASAGCGLSSTSHPMRKRSVDEPHGGRGGKRSRRGEAPTGRISATDGEGGGAGQQKGEGGEGGEGGEASSGVKGEVESIGGLFTIRPPAPLPEEVFRTIDDDMRWQSSCMAIVPFTPRSEFLSRVSGGAAAGPEHGGGGGGGGGGGSGSDVGVGMDTSGYLSWHASAISSAISSSPQMGLGMEVEQSQPMSGQRFGSDSSCQGKNGSGVPWWYPQEESEFVADVTQDMEM